MSPVQQRVVDSFRKKYSINLDDGEFNFVVGQVMTKESENDSFDELEGQIEWVFSCEWDCEMWDWYTDVPSQSDHNLLIT